MFSDVIKDFVIKAKAKATALRPRGASRTRTSPRGHVTGDVCWWLTCRVNRRRRIWWCTRGRR